MASSTKLCSTCSTALKTGLEQSNKHLSTDLDHHATLDCLLEAVAEQCFICTIIWKSFSEETRSGWTSGTVDWGLVHCSLQRRLWLEPPYVQCLYLELHLSTKGGRPQAVSFCLCPSRSKRLQAIGVSLSQTRVHQALTLQQAMITGVVFAQKLETTHPPRRHWT